MTPALGILLEADIWVLLKVAFNKKVSPKHVSSIKCPNIFVNKNDIFSPKSISMPLEKDFSSSIERSAPCHIVKIPFNYRSCSNQRSSLDLLSTVVQDIGKVRD